MAVTEDGTAEARDGKSLQALIPCGLEHGSEVQRA
jgi:hypothetical protein